MRLNTGLIWTRTEWEHGLEHLTDASLLVSLPLTH